MGSDQWDLVLPAASRRVSASAHPRQVVPSNITIIALQPKCPELNPVENVWQFMRDNWLSNRIFKSYDDLVDHCCEAWNKLIDQPRAHHVHRTAPMGARVLINGMRY